MRSQDLNTAIAGTGMLRGLTLASVALALVACSSSDKIPSSQIDGSAVTTPALSDKSVTNVKLADAAVDGRTLAAGAVQATSLAQGAVGPDALAAGAVGSAALASGSVTTALLSQSAVTTDQLGAQSVTTGALKDHAVTAIKLATDAALLKLNGMTGGVRIAGGANVSVNVSGNALGLSLAGPVNASTVGGLAATAFTRRVPNVITVAPSGADFSTIGEAVASVGDASATNRYVVEIAPGVYPEQVVLKPYVSLVGSGVESTRIVYSGGTDAVSGATVIGKDAADVSDLSIVSSGGDFSIGLYASGKGTTVLRNVELDVSSAASTDFGIYAENEAQVVMRQSTVATDIGGTPNATVYGVIATFAALVRCDVCQISATPGSGYALFQLGGNVDVAASRIEGAVDTSSAIHCPASYDETYAAKTGC